MKRKIITTTFFLTLFSFAFQFKAMPNKKPINMRAKNEETSNRIGTILNNYKNSCELNKTSFISMTKSLSNLNMPGRISKLELGKTYFETFCTKQNIFLKDSKINDEVIKLTITNPNNSDEHFNDFINKNYVFDRNFKIYCYNEKNLILEKIHEDLLCKILNKDITFEYKIYALDKTGAKIELIFDKNKCILSRDTCELLIELNHNPVIIAEYKEINNYELTSKYEIIDNNDILEVKEDNDNKFYLQEVSYIHKYINNNENIIELKSLEINKKNIEEFKKHINDFSSIKVSYVKLNKKNLTKTHKITLKTDSKTRKDNEEISVYNNLIIPEYINDINVTQNVLNRVETINQYHPQEFLGHSQYLDESLARQICPDYCSLYKLKGIKINNKEIDIKSYNKFLTNNIKILDYCFKDYHEKYLTNAIIYTFYQNQELSMYDIDNLEDNSDIVIEYEKVNSVQTSIECSFPLQLQQNSENVGVNKWISKTEPIFDIYVKHLFNLHTIFNVEKENGKEYFVANIDIPDSLYIRETFLYLHRDLLDKTNIKKTPDASLLKQFILKNLVVLIDNEQVLLQEHDKKNEDPNFDYKFSKGGLIFQCNNFSKKKNRDIILTKNTHKLNDQRDDNSLFIRTPGNQGELEYNLSTYTLKIQKLEGDDNERNFNLVLRYGIDDLDNKSVTLSRNVMLHHVTTRRQYPKKALYNINLKIIKFKTTQDNKLEQYIEKDVTRIINKEFIMNDKVIDVINPFLEQTSLKREYYKENQTCRIKFNNKQCSSQDLIQSYYNLDASVIDYQNIEITLIRSIDFGHLINKEFTYQNIDKQTIKITDENYLKELNKTVTISNTNAIIEQGTNVEIRINPYLLKLLHFELENVTYNSLGSKKCKQLTNKAKSGNENVYKINTSFDITTLNKLNITIHINLKSTIHVFSHNKVEYRMTWGVGKYSKFEAEERNTDYKCEKAMLTYHSEAHFDENMKNFIQDLYDSNQDGYKEIIKKYYNKGFNKDGKFNYNDYEKQSCIISQNLLISILKNDTNLEEINQDRKYLIRKEKQELFNKNCIFFKIRKSFTFNRKTYSCYVIFYIIEGNPNKHIYLVSCGVDTEDNNTKK